MKHFGIVFASLGLLLGVVTETVSGASTTGTITCKAERNAVSTATAHWESSKKHLRIRIFKSPDDKKTFGDLTLMMKVDSGQVKREEINAYFFYIRCPELQINLNKIPEPFPEMFYKEFPNFSADLKKGGTLSLSFKGNDELMDHPVSWDLSISTTITE